MTEEERKTVFVWSSGDIRLSSEAPRPARRRGRKVSPASAPDSRRYPRLDLKCPVLYRVLGEAADHVPSAVQPYLLAKSRDASPLGLCLSLEEPLPVGVVLALNIHLVDQREKFEALARVVWSRPAGDGACHLTGLQFVVVDGGRFREERHARMEQVLDSLIE